MLEELLNYGRVRSVWMGMVAKDMTAEHAVSLNLPTSDGVLVWQINEDGPAYKAGIRVGDQIVAVNGLHVQDVDHANRLVFGSKVGDNLTIDINRRGDAKSLDLVLEERPDDI